jgi:undecaprenyl-phosphate 4-deoxy-4-formamido-L-arabinose transferase
MTRPIVSVVVPVYNEEAVLPQLFERLYAALDALELPYEVVFVDDGSRDRTPELVRHQFNARPQHTRAVFLAVNAGQHMAILAGFAHARGERLVTIDADLQNPPEEIGKLLQEMDRGHDYVGGIRRDRHDSWWRKRASRFVNWVREKTTRIHLTDQGCMLRAYDRSVVDAILRSGEAHTFIPALAYGYARNPVEVQVEHAERAGGISKYSLLRLVQLNFDLMTGFSVAPLRMFSLFGMVVAALSGAFFVYLVVRRFTVGPEAEGLFTLFAIAFLLIGIALFGIGLVGEYVGRIYEQVRERPRYLVHEVLEADDGSATAAVEAQQSAAPTAAGRVAIRR